MVRIKLPQLHSDFSVDCVIFRFVEGELKVLLIPSHKKQTGVAHRIARLFSLTRKIYDA